VPEVRRLLLALVEPPERFPFRLAWSVFRRHHQAVAKACHVARRARQTPTQSSTPRVQVLEAASLDLTDEQWARIAPLLPPQKPVIGRPMLDHRQIVGGMLWIAGTGASWRALPAEFGPWHTVYSRYRRWRSDGIWQRIIGTFRQPSTASSC
jgi:transposase